MDAVIQLKKPAKPQFSNIQKTFNRLKNKIEVLQQKQQALNKKLDEGLQFYYERIRPAEEAYIEVINQFVKIMYRYYKDKRLFSKRERHVIREMISIKLGSICASTHPNDVDPEIRAIFKDIEGVSYDQVVSETFDVFKTEMEEFLKDQGMNVDLSEMGIGEDDDELMQQFFEAVSEAKSFEKADEPIKPKSKKQLEKELKEQELQELQEKGLGSIYKRLVKIFHPDLEQCSEQKAEKEELMKRLTCAYNKDDLHTLLSLEREGMNRFEQRDVAQSDEQLKIYNTILKDQVDELQEGLKAAPLDPKYAPIRRFIKGGDDLSFALKRFWKEFNLERDYFQSCVNELQSKDPTTAVRDIIQGFLV